MIYFLSKPYSMKLTSNYINSRLMSIYQIILHLKEWLIWFLLRRKYRLYTIQLMCISVTFLESVFHCSIFLERASEKIPNVRKKACWVVWRVLNFEDKKSTQSCRNYYVWTAKEKLELSSHAVRNGVSNTVNIIAV